MKIKKIKPIPKSLRGIDKVYWASIAAQDALDLQHIAKKNAKYIVKYNKMIKGAK